MNANSRTPAIQSEQAPKEDWAALAKEVDEKAITLIDFRDYPAKII